jgi:N-acetylmuramoyl-L-alanine amidase
LPIVMSARIGEHQDRTRLVIELSDPVNLRAFALANPDRVVIDMPEVSWRLGRRRAPAVMARSNPIASVSSAPAIRAW